MWSAIFILAVIFLIVGWLMVKKDRLPKDHNEVTIKKVEFNSLSLLQRIHVLRNKTAELQFSNLSPCKDKLKLLLCRLKIIKVDCHTNPEQYMRDYKVQCMKLIMWYEEFDEYKNR